MLGLSASPIVMGSLRLQRKRPNNGSKYSLLEGRPKRLGIMFRHEALGYQQPARHHQQAFGASGMPSRSQLVSSRSSDGGDVEFAGSKTLMNIHGQYTEEAGGSRQREVGSLCLQPKWQYK